MSEESIKQEWIVIDAYDGEVTFHVTRDEAVTFAKARIEQCLDDGIWNMEAAEQIYVAKQVLASVVVNEVTADELDEHGEHPDYPDRDFSNLSSGEVTSSCEFKLTDGTNFE